MIAELEHCVEIKGFLGDGFLHPSLKGMMFLHPSLKGMMFLHPSLKGMGGFVSLRHHPYSSFLLKAFTTNRYAIGWAFLILACLQAYSLCSFMSKFRI
jgi:hypothetical protein